MFKTLTEKLKGYDIALQGSNRDENVHRRRLQRDRIAGSRYLYDRHFRDTPLADINLAIPERICRTCGPSATKAATG